MESSDVAGNLADVVLRSARDRSMPFEALWSASYAGTRTRNAWMNQSSGGAMLSTADHSLITESS